MRVALLTAGGYPYRRDALSTWCRLLVTGLDRCTFHLRTLTDRPVGGPPPGPLPGHVADAAAIAVGTAARRPPGDRREAAVAGAALLCRGLLGGDRHSRAMVADGLRRLAAVAADDTDPLRDVPLAALLRDAWRTAGHRDLGNADAAGASALLRNACRALAAPLPAADLVHCVGGTGPLLAALAGHWRTGTPLVVTDARSGSRPGEERHSPAVRAVLRQFRGAVAAAGYAAAALVAPLSDHHRARALEGGADPARLVTVPPAAEPDRLLPGPDLVHRPSLIWTGTHPGPELRCVLEAFGHTLAAVPGTVLHLFAPDAARGRLRSYADEVGLGGSVRIARAPADHRQAYATGQVTVHCPGADEPPHRLLQAMFAGCAIVGADHGPVGETLADTGLVVPAGDPMSLAMACIGLLLDPGRRRRLGAAARERALARYTPDRLVRAYAAIYEDVTAPPARPDPRHDLDPAVPAPRRPAPVTMQWLPGPAGPAPTLDQPGELHPVAGRPAGSPAATPGPSGEQHPVAGRPAGSGTRGIATVPGQAARPAAGPPVWREPAPHTDPPPWPDPRPRPAAADRFGLDPEVVVELPVERIARPGPDPADVPEWPPAGPAQTGRSQ